MSTDLAAKVTQAASKESEWVRAQRRDIHRHPELGFETPRTAALVKKHLSPLGLKIIDGVAKNGLWADLIVDPSYPMIALRADMDALPIQEESESEYRSTIDGCAHLCGHDAHTAMLMGAAKVLQHMRSELKCNVRFVFQPNEEQLPGGAPAMIEAGVLEGVEMIFGLHVWPEIASGQIGICEGPAMAQPDEFSVFVSGVGGHAAEPHRCRDSIVAGSLLIQAMQPLVSRRCDPEDSAVLSVTQFHAGSTHNVIPQRAFINGTVRTFEPHVQKIIKGDLEQLCAQMGPALGVEFKLEYLQGYPVTLNHPQASQVALSAARDLLGEELVQWPAKRTMGGEDFAYYSQKIPACFSFLGIKNPPRGIIYSCHHPRFDVDEDRLSLGVAFHAMQCLGYGDRA